MDLAEFLSAQAAVAEAAAAEAEAARDRAMAALAECNRITEESRARLDRPRRWWRR